MADIKQQIMVLPNIYNNASSSRMIGFMISRTLRSFLYHRNDKAEYFASDYEEGLDLSTCPRPDIILFDKTENEEEARNAYALAETANPKSRIFMQLEDEFIDQSKIGPRSKLFTYSMESPDANFFAQKITERPEGGYTMEIVFHANPKGAKGLSAIFFPAFNRGLVFKTAINSNDRNDVIHAVKTFAAGSALSIEPKYINREIGNFIFDGYKKNSEFEKEEESAHQAKVMSRKEFEED